MGTADVCQYTDGRLNHAFQRFHLPRFGYPCFEDAQFRLLVHTPHRQRDTNLRIITAGRTHNCPASLQQLMQPFFHNRLPITTRNADDRNLKT